MELKDEYTGPELASELGVSNSTVRFYVAEGQLTPTRKQKGDRGLPKNIFSKAEVERFLEWKYGQKGHRR